MKKFFITSDTHSFYNELIEELKIKGFNLDDNREMGEVKS